MRGSEMVVLAIVFVTIAGVVLAAVLWSRMQPETPRSQPPAEPLPPLRPPSPTFESPLDEILAQPDCAAPVEKNQVAEELARAWSTLDGVLGPNLAAVLDAARIFGRVIATDSKCASAWVGL